MPNTGEEIFFNDGDVDGFYDIINWQVNNNGEISYVTVGNYNGSAAPENRMTIMNDSIVWNNDMLEVSGISIKKKLAYAPFRLWFGSSCISVAMCKASSVSVQWELSAGHQEGDSTGRAGLLLWLHSLCWRRDQQHNWSVNNRTTFLKWYMGSFFYSTWVLKALCTTCLIHTFIL